MTLDNRIRAEIICELKTSALPLTKKLQTKLEYQGELSGTKERK